MKKILILILALSLFSRTTNAQVIQSDFDALVALYNATNGDNWTNNDGWSTTTNNVSNSWFGITVTGDRVTQIDLTSNNLIGAIPSAISGLTVLEDLRLNNNQITSIPAEIGSFSVMIRLWLGNNLLTGIPAEIGDLSALLSFDLSQNQLAALPAEIGNLTELLSLNLWGNQLSTVPSTVGNLTKLTGVYLYSNQLTSLPSEIGGWTSMIYLRLNDNQLSSIPAEIANMALLEELRLNGNRLSSLPDLSALTSLSTSFVENNLLDFGDLEASNTYWDTYSPQADIQLDRSESAGQVTFSCTVSGTNNQYKWFKDNVEITGETTNTLTINDTETGGYYCEITNVGYLLLTLKSTDGYIGLINGVVKEDYDALIALYDATGGNNWTNKTNWKTSNPVSTWYGVRVVGNRVVEIDLGNNNMVGGIPPEISGLTSLSLLDLGTNKINNIPAEIGLLTNLTTLILAHNLITSIPPEIGNLSILQRLQLISNQITDIPIEIANLSELTNLNVGWNKLTVVPDAISNLSKLEALGLTANQISNIPLAIYNMTSLRYLYIGFNNITSIPTAIGNLTGLIYLDLSGNELTELPATIGNLINLQYFYAYNNNITILPPEISNWTSLSFLRLDDNQLSTFPVAIQNFTSLTDLRMNRNRFSNLPDLSALTNLSTTYIENNLLDFGDLQASGISWGTYSPQADIQLDKIESGSLVTFSCNVSGVNNQYKWFKDGAEIPGETSSSITVANTLVATYYCEITNTGYPLLTLKSTNGNVGLINGVVKVDYDALVALYDSTGGVNWKDNTNWKTSNLVSTWNGVTVVNSRVLRINLTFNNLVGDIPTEIGGLTALENLWLGANKITSVPDEIGSLQALINLYIGSNQLTEIPVGIGNLDLLQELVLASNQLVSLPVEIGNLSELVSLNVSGNQFSSLPSSIGNLTKLVEAYLYGNKLTILPPEIQNLTLLEVLRLDDNKLSSLPDLSALTNLTTAFNENNLLDFGDLETSAISWDKYSPQANIQLERVESAGQITLTCNVSGTNNQYKWFKNNVEIAGETTNMLIVSDTQSGVFFCEIADTNYPLLTLTSTTEAIGIVYGVVKSDYDALIAFYDATGGADWRNNTNWKSSESVETWYGLTVVDFRVVQIDLEYNNLTGAIPPEIGFLTALEDFRLNNNQITSIPVEIGSFPVMIRLWLGNNMLTEIPAEIGNLSALQSFDFSQNQLTTLPVEVGNLTELVSLNLWGNQLSTIPSTVGNLTKLTGVYLYSNQLTSLPSGIGNWTSMIYLRLNDNQLSTIPPEIANMTLLEELRLNDNKLSSLSDLSVLTSLNTLYLQNNLFDFGDLETVNVNWTNITYSSYSPQADVMINLTENTNDYTLTVTVDGTNNAYKWYKDDVEITGETTNSIIISKTAGASVYYCEITDTDFPDLTLSSKTVFLPAGVSKAEYDALVAIYSATGGDNWTDNTNWLSDKPVNDWYGVDVALSKVMGLDLSNNNLSGNIPPEIDDLYALSILNFDDNVLSGTIPWQVGNLPGLFMLGLNNNSFSGAIPNSLGYLSKLYYLGLSDNLLDGTVPSDIANLNNLAYLVLFDNQLSGLPDLSAMQNVETISVELNNLTFEDIEPNLSVASLGFSYSPQAKVGEAETHYLANGDNDTLVVSVGGEHNVYKWYKDGSPVSGSDNDSLFIENFSAADAGEYYCEITNSVATALTLHSDTITLLEAYSAKFTVSDRNGALSNANVAVTGYESKTTDAQGVAVFKIKPANGVSYSVSTAEHVNYTGAFDIVDKDEQIDVVMVITGIDDINKTNIKVYPNPSNGQFTIDIGDLQIKNTYLKILDINGRLVYREKLNAAKTQINIPANHQGLSIIQVSDDENVYLKEKIFIVK